MARRKRGLLIDSTLGKVWSNIDDVASGNASLLIAGTKLQSKVFSQSSTTVVNAATNLGSGPGLYFPTQTLVQFSCCPTMAYLTFFRRQLG